MLRLRRYWPGLVLLGLAGWQFGAGAYIDGKAVLAQVLLHRAWASTAEGGQHVRPWPWADTWPVARLRIPAVDIDTIVLAGSTGRTLAFAPGYMLASAAPGTAGNTIISAHRDTHFRALAKIRRKEQIELDTPQGRHFVYRVTDIRVVDSRTARLQVNASRSTLTLITCYPFDAVVPGGPLRFVVRAELAGPKTGIATFPP